MTPMQTRTVGARDRSLMHRMACSQSAVVGGKPERAMPIEEQVNFILQPGGMYSTVTSIAAAK